MTVTMKEMEAALLVDALNEFLELPVGTNIFAGLCLWVYTKTGVNAHWHWCGQMAWRFYGPNKHDPYIDEIEVVTERRLEFARRLIEAIENGEYGE